MRSLLDGLFDLFERLHVAVGAVDIDQGLANGRLETSFAIPLKGLDGDELATVAAHGRLSFGTSSSAYHACGFKCRCWVHLSFDRYLLAPVGPGLLHDNRSWSAINRPLVAALFTGLRDLDLTYVPLHDDRHLTPVDAFGFAEADLDWLRSELDRRWRSVAEGRLSLEEAEQEPDPVAPERNPIHWKLFGVKRSLAELENLMDGVPGGAAAAARIFPWYEVAESAQDVAHEDELLATGSVLRDQLLLAVSRIDRSLSDRMRALPVVMRSERAEANERVRSLISLRDLHKRLLGVDPQRRTDTMRQFSRETYPMGCPLMACHFASPIYGLDIDLGAAFDLWRLGGAVEVNDNAFLLGANHDYWLRWLP